MQRDHVARLAAFGTLIVASAILVAGAGLSGCGSDSTASTPPPLATGTPVVRDAAPDTAAPPLDASPRPGVDAGAPSYHFTGSLAATAPSDFGGSPYCKYRITLKQIDVDIAFDGAGEVIGGSVSNLAVEESVPPCPNGAVPPNIHKYTAASAGKLPSGGVHIVLGPDPENQPKASLVLDGDFRGGTAQASLEWHRTDQNAPLDWRVTAKIPLVRH
jgi:hypothetical protein